MSGEDFFGQRGAARVPAPLPASSGSSEPNSGAGSPRRHSSDSVRRAALPATLYHKPWTLDCYRSAQLPVAAPLPGMKLAQALLVVKWAVFSFPCVVRAATS